MRLANRTAPNRPRFENRVWGLQPFGAHPTAGGPATEAPGFALTGQTYLP